MLANTRVVLVRSHYAGNIGSVARAMANFGMRDLVLVDPVADPNAHQARMLAAGGVSVLDSLRVMTWEQAVADCLLVFATSSEVGGTLRGTMAGSPAELMPKFAAGLSAGPCALVFGPEPHGLTTEELGRAHALLHLPANPEYNSLNLALAAGIVLYELWNAARGGTPELVRPPAAAAEVDRALAHLEQSLHSISFLFGQNAPHLMHGFRHLILRAAPTSQEVGMLHGLARQLDYIAGRWQVAEAHLKDATPPRV